MPLAKTVTVLLMLMSTALAQADRDTALRERRAAKLAAEVFAMNTWTTDLAEARREAAATRRPIFVYFTRSYSP